LRRWVGEAQAALRHAVEVVVAACYGRAEQLADSGSSAPIGSNCRCAPSRHREELDRTQEEVNEMMFVWLQCFISEFCSSLSQSLYPLLNLPFHHLLRRRRTVESSPSLDEEGEGGAQTGQAAVALVASDPSLPKDASAFLLPMDCKLT
jgi:hypothetical protein